MNHMVWWDVEGYLQKMHEKTTMINGGETIDK